MRPAHTPSSVKGSISRCVVSLHKHNDKRRHAQHGESRDLTHPPSRPPRKPVVCFSIYTSNTTGLLSSYPSEERSRKQPVLGKHHFSLINPSMIHSLRLWWSGYSLGDHVLIESYLTVVLLVHVQILHQTLVKEVLKGSDKTGVISQSTIHRLHDNTGQERWDTSINNTPPQ